MGYIRPGAALPIACQSPKMCESLHTSPTIYFAAASDPPERSRSGGPDPCGASSHWTPLEGDGFEPSVPRQKDRFFETRLSQHARHRRFENARRPVQQLLPPVVDPVRMNAELTRQLGDRPVPPTAATTPSLSSPRCASSSSPAPALSRFLGGRAPP